MRPSPPSSLSVRDAHGAWKIIWSSASSPTSWRGAPLVASIPWRGGGDGLRWGKIIDSVVYPLRADGRGVSVTHRDARAAICLAHDGHVIVALTRFDGLGRAFGFIPFGLTAPEMAAVMGELGCRDAMLLDGGIGAQLLVRDASGESHRWPGIRAVPLALLADRRREAVSLVRLGRGGRSPSAASGKG